MRKILRIFFSTPDTRPFLVLICFLLSGLAEAISISSLLPAAATMAGGETGKSSPLGHFIDRIFEAIGLTPTIGNIVLLVSGFMILKAVLSFAALSYAGVAAARVAIGFRRRLIAAVFEAKWGFFADQRSGKFANVISNDAGRAGDAYLMSAQVLAYIIQVVAYAGIAAAIDLQLAVLGLCASLIVALALRQLIRNVKRAGYKQTDRTEALTVYMVELLTNIKPLKSMHRHEAMLNSISKVLTKLKRALVTRELSKAGLAQGSDALIAILAGTGLYFAVAVSKVSLPELVVSGVVFMQVVSITSKLQRLLQQAVQVESAYVRTADLIGLAESNHETNLGKIVPDGRASCHFEHVSFSHGSTLVIRDVTFEVPHAAITVLSGPSGSGKTTIIDLLIGLHRADSGRILIGGTPIQDVDMRAWRKMIGYVPQELNLFHASVRENIMLGDTSLSDSAITEALSQAGASDFISSLPHGLDTDVGEMGAKFSGGQRQRISLARALVTKPQVLILDEVTSALDPATELEIVENIASLRGNYTIIAITHRPAWTRVADRLYKVSHGKVTSVVPGQGFAKGRKARKSVTKTIG